MKSWKQSTLSAAISPPHVDTELLKNLDERIAARSKRNGGP
jgi:hypothetical protein